MGKVITVMNMKGGVGKTTVTTNIGGLLGSSMVGGKRRKVLLIDYDPQFNLSQTFLQSKKYFELDKDKKTILSVLVAPDSDLNPFKLTIPELDKPPKIASLAIPIQTSMRGGTLDLVPSTLDLMYLALGDIQAPTRGRINSRFTTFLNECKASYDLIFIDCHPAGSIFTKTALRNSDHVLIPVIPSAYASRGVGMMKQFIDDIHVNDVPPKTHILFNCVSRTATSGIELEIRKNPRLKALCLGETLKKFKAFSEPSEGTGFVWKSKKPYSTTAYHNLRTVALELLKEIGE
jgi:chromosome partitioning protein